MNAAEALSRAAPLVDDLAATLGWSRASAEEAVLEYLTGRTTRRTPTQPALLASTELLATSGGYGAPLPTRRVDGSMDSDVTDDGSSHDQLRQRGLELQATLPCHRGGERGG